MATWVHEMLPLEATAQAQTDAVETRIEKALELPRSAIDERQLRFIAEGYELAIHELLDQEGSDDELRDTAAPAFGVLRVLPRPVDPLAAARWLTRLGCLAVLADRRADIGRILVDEPWPDPDLSQADWGRRVESAIWEAWLRIIRKHGWEDLDAVQRLIGDLRDAQREYEEGYLSQPDHQARADAWRLVALYHLARAAEISAHYSAEGSVEGHFDVREQLEAQFDRALHACSRAELIDLDGLIRLVARAAARLVDNSIWTVTRAVNSRVTQFVESLAGRQRPRPIFEVLPPQRHALRERGLLGAAARAVVVSLPTSSGKTFIAQFRILQAINQFERERGWVAYLVPTRALVNQIARRLREDFAPLGLSVERVSPALEVDGLEADLLLDQAEETQFRVLVTTPEKLDLLLRGGWESEIGRPLTLVVVDEAHNLIQPERGIRLELLLATINRECRYAQFLLLTPFVENARTVVQWLAPDSHDEVQLEVEWVPNDRAVMLSRPVRGSRPGDFHVEFEPLHTTRQTLYLERRFQVGPNRPLGMSWSAAKSPGLLAAATASVLGERGTVIVLAQQIRHCWSLAARLVEGGIRRADPSADLELVRNYLADELGDAFPLVSYLEHGVGVHHSGLSEDARALQEWLLEKDEVDFLVATTTIAQGVNFPVASVVLASHQYPYGQDMPPEDFWNLAGRTGRVDQGDLGIVALAATSEDRAEILTRFVDRAVQALNSTLVRMVVQAEHAVSDRELHRLAYQPEWSSFLQYLAHSYRLINDPARFATEVEQVLRGALGYQQLRRAQPRLARDLLGAVEDYAERLAGKPLGLVDATGFSWESVNATLFRLGEEQIDAGVWDARALFAEPEGNLRRLMGIILQVPELRANLDFAIGGRALSGSLLAEVTSDWVQGRRLTEIAEDHFLLKPSGPVSYEQAMTECCRVIYGKLAPTVSWGLSALQSLTLRGEITGEQAQTLRNLPSRVLYGVNSDDAIALRLLGVPRQAAEPLAPHLTALTEKAPIGQVRRELADADRETWTRALGNRGDMYRSIWHVLEGGQR
jgi:superfamily II DNA/RNA helicase